MMDYRESFHIAVTDGESDFAKLLVQMSKDMMHAQLPDQPELWYVFSVTLRGLEVMVAGMNESMQ
jgi:hypothetical protein